MSKSRPSLSLPVDTRQLRVDQGAHCLLLGEKEDLGSFHRDAPLSPEGQSDFGMDVEPSSECQHGFHIDMELSQDQDDFGMDEPPLPECQDNLGMYAGHSPESRHSFGMDGSPSPSRKYGFDMSASHSPSSQCSFSMNASPSPSSQHSFGMDTSPSPQASPSSKHSFGMGALPSPNAQADFDLEAALSHEVQDQGTDPELPKEDGAIGVKALQLQEAQEFGISSPPAQVDNLGMYFPPPTEADEPSSNPPARRESHVHLL
jgi:hypothetical protein